MKTTNLNLPRAARCLVPAMLMAALAVPAAAQQLAGTTYGEPSECTPGSPARLGLYLRNVKGEVPALSLEGGTAGAPAFVLLGGQASDTQLPGGGKMLVGAVSKVMAGSFDHQGSCLFPLAGDYAAAAVAVFAQGLQPMSGSFGTELSAGLRIEVQAPECAPVPAPGQPSPEEPATGEPASMWPETIIVDEFATAIFNGNFETALAQALNSKGDQLALEISGSLEVPVPVPGVTVGGKASFKASIQRGENGDKETVYDVVIAADVAASAGVGAGVAGAGISAGHGGELVWRYKSTHEVARALRSMAILQAVNNKLEAVCLVLDTQIENLDRAIGATRQVADNARQAWRSHMPWRNSPIVKKVHQVLDSARAARRATADRARRTVGNLIGWVAGERIFLTLHLHGYELHSTQAIEASLSTSFVKFGSDSNKGDTSGTGLNLGASLGVGIERQQGLRVERVPESEAMFVQHKMTFTKNVGASAGLLVGGSVSGKRVIEVTSKMQFGKDGRQTADCGTTVKLQLDGRLLIAAGAFVVGQAGVGGEFAVEMKLADLSAYSTEAIGILMGDDEGKLVALLRALPIKVETRGRYEAGVAVGFGIEVKGVFKGGLGASAMLIDRGQGYAYQGGSEASDAGAAQLVGSAVAAMRDGPIERAKNVFAPRIGAVHAEVKSVMQR